MSTTSALKLEIEHKLAGRFPAALTPPTRTVRECATVGIPEIDALLGGGLPIGAISEIIGPASSGRTCLALSFVAQRTNAGHVCAWVDVGNALDPESAAACGVNLRRLLWVRCQGVVVQAKGKPWVPLDRALRATDLLLQAGGFAAIVVDMGDLVPEQCRRIPLATWYRFRQAADQSRTSLITLGKAAYAQASAAVVLGCSPSKVQTSSRTVLNGSVFDVRLTREKTIASLGITRKPPVSTWTADSTWEIERQ
jgi:hypothetical protein